MDVLRARARRSLEEVEFTGRIGDIQIIDTLNRTFKVDASGFTRPLSPPRRDSYGSLLPPIPSYLTRTIGPEKLFERINHTSPSTASGEPDVLLVYVSLSHANALDIDRELFLRIFDSMSLDPLILRFLGRWDPGSCQTSSMGNYTSYYMNYVRMRGHCLMWAYDKTARSVRGIILPKTFNPNVHTMFQPSFKFLNTLVGNLWIHRSFLVEEHGFMYVCCASIVERISSILSDAYAMIAVVEQGTKHSTWNVDHPRTLNDMTEGSKDVGSAKHRLFLVKRHTDCVNEAYCIVLSTLKPDQTESPAIEPLRLLKNELEALERETESLLQRAQNQMSVVCLFRISLPSHPIDNCTVI
jgi:hypothetical protein